MRNDELCTLRVRDMCLRHVICRFRGVICVLRTRDMLLTQRFGSFLRDAKNIFIKIIDM